MPKKLPSFIILQGTVPEDDDNGGNVYHKLDEAISEASDDVDDDGDVFTIYELVPRARVSVPPTPEVKVIRL